jgi:uncharacterized protein (TIGR03032 family)
MKIKSEFIRLPLRFDVDRLSEEVLQFAETDWRPHPQGYPGNTALPLIAAHGDPSNDEVKGPMAPTPHLRRMPYVRQVLASFGSVIGRTRLMRIDGNAEATAHIDSHYYWLQRVRIHVPIITDPAVQFFCGERSIHMPAGESWIFNTWQKHNVINPNPSRRIHLVADSLGSSLFWDLVDRAAETPKLVPFDREREADLHIETVNSPVVMSPYEQGSLLNLLFEDLPPNDDYAHSLRHELKRFNRDWAVLWSEHGEAPSGWRAFTRLRDQLSQIMVKFDDRIRLQNGLDAAEAVRQMLVRPAINSDLARLSQLQPEPGRRRINRPIFIVSSPRSGSTMLFETLAQSPSVATIGGESHSVIEGIPALNPGRRGFDSNRLLPSDADVSTAAVLEERFYTRLRDRDGVKATGEARMLEKTPKNSLRIPFLNAVFPDAFFVYLYRDPRATISSMLDAWRSGKFVTYPDLPGWQGLPWSLVLVPGWRKLIGKSLPEIVAAQWATATTTLLDDLEQLPSERWCVAGYREIVDDPQAEMKRICEFVDIEWDRELTAPLPLSRHTLTPPDPNKVVKNGPDLDSIANMIEPVVERARDLFARPPAMRTRKPRSEMPSTASTPSPEKPSFGSVYTPRMPEILNALGVTLIVSTYQSGRLVLVRAENDTVLNTHFRAMASPMGIAVGQTSLAVGTKQEVWDYRNQREVTARLEPAGKHDACFVPRNVHYTGDIRIHEVGFAGDELWVVNTRFSTLCTIDADHSFVPRWRPKFITHLAPEDRCHLNGLSIVDGRIRYVTALGDTNEAHGWREKKATGGLVIDVPSDEIVARGLSMPHSPRWYAGKFWILESGKGTFASLDLATGKVETIVELPGFTRGLAFAGPFAFVGLSQVRESNIFGGIPLVDRVQERLCGVWAIDLRTGGVAGYMQFQGAVQEIFDVQVLHGVRYPELLEPGSELIGSSFVVPQGVLHEVANEKM